MKKTMILLSTLLATSASASHTIPIHNLSNKCFCTISAEWGGICRKDTTHPVAAEFGTVTNGKFTPTHPPSVALPGGNSTAPITDVVGGKGIALTLPSHYGSYFHQTLWDLGNPSALIVVDTIVNRQPPRPMVFKSSWIHPDNCHFYAH